MDEEHKDNRIKTGLFNGQLLRQVIYLKSSAIKTVLDFLKWKFSKCLTIVHVCVGVIVCPTSQDTPKGYE